LFNLKTDPSHVIASPTSCEEHAFGMTGVAIQEPTYSAPARSLASSHDAKRSSQ
jgi:hypothetical protein